LVRGKKPKPRHLRLVDGSHRPERHGDIAAARSAVESQATSFGPLLRPKFLAGAARDAWSRYIEPATWLDASREPAAIVFCELWKEMRNSPTSFQAAKHSQLRAYMSELGLTDERNRTLKPDKEEEDEFFD
jgi:phage terminase small subunit